MATKEYNRFMDDLYEMSETTFEHIYEMTKRAACVRFQLEAYTVGYQDAHAGREAEGSSYTSAANQRYYAEGYRAAERRQEAQAV